MFKGILYTIFAILITGLTVLALDGLLNDFSLYKKAASYFVPETKQNTIQKEPLEEKTQIKTVGGTNVQIDNLNRTNDNFGGSNADSLFQALASGQMGSFKLMLNQIEDVDMRGAGDKTILMETASYSEPAILDMIIKKGANLNAQDRYGRTPLMFAISGGKINNASKLLAYGADPNIKDMDGSTALQTASSKDMQQAIEMLIERGAEVSSGDRKGNTALHYASKFGHKRTVDMLIEHGSDVNSPNRNGRTPLMIAAEHGSSQVIVSLLSHGADKTTKDKFGLTAFDYAMRYNHNKIAALLNVEEAATDNKKTDVNDNIEIKTVPFDEGKME